MHREAEGDLPRLLKQLDIRRPILLGHSDGASIALIYAASDHDPAPLGLALLAPHVKVEERTLQGAREAAAAFQAGPLREALARHHADVDATFRGWNETWLSAAFRGWNIEECLEHVRCPVSVVQGLDDRYGTLGQIRPIVERVRQPVEVLLLQGCGHAPERDQPETTLDSVVAFADQVTRRDPAARTRFIYHLTTPAELEAGLTEEDYRPVHLATEGFVHCTSSPATTLAVADDLFADADSLALRIEVKRLSAPLRFEPPAPVSGGTRHRRLARLFPHVYGAIDRAAIRGAALMPREDGRHVWPRALPPLVSGHACLL
jgi:uncharacterized protein (DUF952 family)